MIFSKLSLLGLLIVCLFICSCYQNDPNKSFDQDSSIQEKVSAEGINTENKTAQIQASNELVLHFTGPINRFDDLDFLQAPITKADQTTFFKSIAPAFISQNNCECDQLETIKNMEYGYDYALTKFGNSYLCDVDNDGDQDYLVPIVCSKDKKISITIAFVNDSEDSDYFRIRSNNFIEFTEDNDTLNCNHD